ncbi:hypothetical protein EAG_00431 [Camponotus floridanus]|uniref:Uncharacterized protein n=1 Tax=Camponotus floridanus TaxID=104421 RepID=E2A7Z0_CAMFO|nr:hypothetical protein EAG_00431 [Camponotus floridanus]
MGFAPRVSPQAVVYGIAGEIAFHPRREDARLASRPRVTDKVRDITSTVKTTSGVCWDCSETSGGGGGGGGGIARWTPRRSQIPRTSSS